MAIWQDLVDQHGFDGRYASVRRFAGRLRVATPEPVGIIETAPDDEAQVDYSEGPMVRDPASGKYKRIRLFVLTLCCSRKSVRLLTWRSSSQRWAELHEEAFRRLGGTPRVIVLDNLREGVLTPEEYDAQLNPLYRNVLAHYGVVALPCRVRDPDRKGKADLLPPAVVHSLAPQAEGMLQDGESVVLRHENARGYGPTGRDSRDHQDGRRHRGHHAPS